MPMPWFRLYSEAHDDRKIAHTARDTGLSKTLVLGTWVSLLCLANQSPERGLLLVGANIPYTLQELAAEIGPDEQQFGMILASFEKFGMVGQSGGIYYITQWTKRQFSSDSSTKRVQRHREKKRQETEEGNGLDTTDWNSSQETFPGDVSMKRTPSSDSNLFCSISNDRQEEEGKVCAAWAEIRGGSLNSFEAEEIGYLIEQYDPARVLAGIKEAVSSNRYDNVSLNFLKKILSSPRRKAGPPVAGDVVDIATGPVAGDVVTAGTEGVS